ncbi:hypothetical protein BDV98DRAFT_607234 [Pterulicium gracile]|uniref:Uncharacterized protein n=1 Tax=Pterulicium gracile TaxID=1884261 RepID=A0A5C3Q7A5_9AGAR|nr:hypothetical protein BDV98DRAFT_607234 [Pterula gracilis]
MHILLKRHPNRRARSKRSTLVSTISASALFLVSTLHLALMILSGVRRFLQGKNAEELYDDINQPSLLADIVLIYRCYIIWDCRWKIIALPCAVFGASGVCGYISASRMSLAKHGSDLFAPEIAPWLKAGGALTVVTNISVTTMIAGRIWWVSRNARNVLPGCYRAKHNRVIAVIIESGGIYSFTLIIFTSLMRIGSQNKIRIVYQALAQLAGITPTLIIVRMGLGLKPQDAAVFSTGPTFNEAPSRWDRPSVDPESQHASVLTIEIQREVDVENGGSGVATDRRATGAGDDEPFALESFHRKGQGKPSGL